MTWNANICLCSLSKNSTLRVNKVSTSHKICTLVYCTLFWSCYIKALAQDFNISIANALEILQSCTKPTILSYHSRFMWFIIHIFQPCFTGTRDIIWLHQCQWSNPEAYGLKHHGPLLLTWFNFNTSMDKYSHDQCSVGWNYSSIPQLQLLHCWSLEWKCNFIPCFM